MHKELSTTFLMAAEKFIEENPTIFIAGDFDGAQKDAIKAFAKYLDGFAVLDDKMQILAYQKAREIDGEVLFALAELLPKDQVEDIIRNVYSKHKHTKNTKDAEAIDSVEETPKGEEEVEETK